MSRTYLVLEVQDVPLKSLDQVVGALRVAGKEVGVVVERPHNVYPYLTLRGRRVAARLLVHGELQDTIEQFADSVVVPAGA